MNQTQACSHLFIGGAIAHIYRALEIKTVIKFNFQIYRSKLLFLTYLILKTKQVFCINRIHSNVEYLLI
ncbi:hypothetical protein [Nostoc sp. FACHB-280]|uniref:hypothetical protein n=1 Tax=Nostoc sp. FACHB-280 TaxID=2692839 RepID=UPI00168B0F4A|nr:hypothetical protein [Nostoc sp. FACHB-280]MBD2496124.1 hypothetical protein [Nostoc sp. FACHB-280]